MTKTNDDKVARKNARESTKALQLAKKPQQKLAAVRKTSLHKKLVQKLPLQRKNLPNLNNDTLDEYRQKIIASGRKFKYPLQYSRHRVLIISLIAVVAALIAFLGFLWFMLYPAQNSDDLYYHATRVAPIPVANVDGQNVRYSDYLVRLRADIFYYQTQERKSFSTKDGKSELDYIKRKDLEAAELAAYAQKIADQKNIAVSDKEISDKIQAQLKVNNSDEASLERTLKNYYNWSIDEYRAVVRQQLLEQRVAFAVDASANQHKDKILSEIKGGADFESLVKKYSDDAAAKDSEDVTETILAGDNSQLALALAKIKPGDITTIETTDLNGGYIYQIAKLISRDDSSSKYEVIQVNVGKFAKDFAKLQSEKKIHEFISVPKLNK